MKIHDVFQDMPRDDAWRALRPKERKEWAVRAIRRMLAMFRNEQSEPDAWETGGLGQAINSVSCGRFTEAVDLVVQALTPIEERSPHSLGGDLISCEALLIALEHAEAVPVPDGNS